MHSKLIYPIYPAGKTLIERLALRTNKIPGYCNVCGEWTLFGDWDANFRDSGKCRRCGSINRHRQMAFLLHSPKRNWKPLKGIPAFIRNSNLRIYNTETSGPLHAFLAKASDYVCSEYFGDNYQPGEIITGKRHEDLMHLSFSEDQFDYVLSGDVFEHIPDPYQAHAEIYRVLKKNGRHVFTVPFHQTRFQDEILALPGKRKPRILQPPIYHLDPLRPGGILVYTIFSIEMLTKLNQIGFRTNMYRLYHPVLGILGNNGLVFEAIKD